jgi:hypothetical protein
MEKKFWWETNSSLYGQNISVLKEPEDSSIYSQQPALELCCGTATDNPYPYTSPLFTDLNARNTMDHIVAFYREPV